MNVTLLSRHCTKPVKWAHFWPPGQLPRSLCAHKSGKHRTNANTRNLFRREASLKQMNFPSTAACLTHTHTLKVRTGQYWTHRWSGGCRPGQPLDCWNKSRQQQQQQQHQQRQQVSTLTLNGEQRQLANPSWDVAHSRFGSHNSSRRPLSRCMSHVSASTCQCWHYNKKFARSGRQQQETNGFSLPRGGL